MDIRMLTKLLWASLMMSIVGAAYADNRCDCAQVIANCTANVTVREQKWIDITSTSQMCSRVDYYLDGNPHVDVVMDGQMTTEWLGPGQIRKVTVDRCTVCVDHLRGGQNASGGASNGTSSSTSNGPAADLGGSWQGQFTYSDGRPGVPMSIDLSDSNGQISGRTTEPNTFGDSSAAQLFANVSGSRSGNSIQFVKTYDGTGGQTHSVNYAGTINSSGTRITGSWSLRGASGGFVISR